MRIERAEPRAECRISGWWGSTVSVRRSQCSMAAILPSVPAAPLCPSRQSPLVAAFRPGGPVRGGLEPGGFGRRRIASEQRGASGSLGGVRSVLRTPGVLPLFLASCVARLPMGALGLLFVLHTQALTGSYARGGLVAAGYTLALGASNPALARLVDRRGQTLVLLAGAPVCATAVATAAVLPAGAAGEWLVVCAIVAGACQPPV